MAIRPSTMCAKVFGHLHAGGPLSWHWHDSLLLHPAEERIMPLQMCSQNFLSILYDGNNLAGQRDYEMSIYNSK